jgi:hypothetical protein
MMREICKSEKESGNVVVVEGLEIGVRYYAVSGEQFIAQFRATPSLLEAGRLSRGEGGHGYVHSSEGEVIRYEVPPNHCGDGGEDTVDVEEATSYTVNLDVVGRRKF